MSLYLIGINFISAMYYVYALTILVSEFWIKHDFFPNLCCLFLKDKDEYQPYRLPLADH